MRFDASPPVRTLAAGIGFSEGPVWTMSQRVVVASVSRGMLYEVALDGAGARPLAEAGGGPNGLAEDAAGTLWIAQNGAAHAPSRSTRPAGPSVQRWTGDAVHDVVTTGLVAPNDCVVAPDGRLWFTDPAGLPDPDDERLGRVCALDVDTNEIEVVVDGVEYPNGLAFGVDPDVFFLVETRRERIVRYRRTAEGLVSCGKFAETVRGPPDGIAVDIEGRIHVSTTDGDCIEIFDAGGTLVGSIDLGPSWPTNCCFGGADMGTLFVTAAKDGRVMAVERDVAGHHPSPWIRQ